MFIVNIIIIINVYCQYYKAYYIIIYSKIIQKSFKNHSKIIQKSFKNHSKISEAVFCQTPCCEDYFVIHVA